MRGPPSQYFKFRRVKHKYDDKNSRVAKGLDCDQGLILRKLIWLSNSRNPFSETSVLAVNLASSHKTALHQAILALKAQISSFDNLK